jgi:FSR family fosmidomycin resistance protein-like MFS transporter
MLFKIRPTLGRSLLLLWFSHLLLDFFTGIWPIYKTIAKIDLVKAGLIAGLAGFFGELLQLLFGYFSDRGYRRIITMLGLALSSSILWITFTDSIFISFFILLMLMMGSGSYHPAAGGFAGLLSKEKKGRNILLFASGGALGLALSQLAFTKALQFFGGHATIFFLPVFLLLLVVALYPIEEQNHNQRLSFREFLQPLMHSKNTLFLLYLTQVCNFSLLTAFMFLLPDLMHCKGCHEWLSMGGGHLCFVIGGAILMIPAGYLSDRFGPKPIVLTTLFFCLLLFYTFLSQAEFSLFKTVAFLMGIGGSMGTVTPVLVSWGNKLIPESPSTVSALMMGCAWCLANLGAAWAGLIANHVKTQEPIVMTLCILGSLLPLSFCLILFTPNTRARVLATR